MLLLLLLHQHELRVKLKRMTRSNLNLHNFFLCYKTSLNSNNYFHQPQVLRRRQNLPHFLLRNVIVKSKFLHFNQCGKKLTSKIWFIFCDLTLQFHITTCTYSKVVRYIRTLVLRCVTKKRKKLRYKLKPVNITVISPILQCYFFPFNKRSFNSNTYFINI